MTMDHPVLQKKNFKTKHQNKKTMMKHHHPEVTLSGTVFAGGKIYAWAGGFDPDIPSAMFVIGDEGTAKCPPVLRP